MPKLLAKVEGKGNGIKTVIVNMPEIAKSLNRPPMYPTKYFGCLLGAQVNFDNKSERYTVSGAHDSNKLQNLLDEFIQKYVLCPSCESSKTMLSVDKKKSAIGLECATCGQTGMVSTSNDSFGAYIQKNPPPRTSETSTAATSSGTGETVAYTAGSRTKDDREKAASYQDDEVDDLDSDDLEELDYGDDDEDFEYQAQNQAPSKQGGSGHKMYGDSMSHQDEDEDEDDDDDDDENREEDDEEVDPDEAGESLDAHPSMEEEDEGQSDTEKIGDKVRCKYWPYCNAQDSCQFYHPTKPCRDFLRCTFGDKCLYIHPPCKFNPNCNKQPACPFSHPAVATTGVKRKTPAMQFRNFQPPTAPKCKYGFKCANLMCKFSHQPSEDCRYGANCLLESCPYNHPTDSMPRKKPASVFKWSAQS